MQSAQLDILRSLLTDRRTLALSVIVEGEPVIGLLPFAALADRHALVVHASRLARHTRGLVDGAPFDALVHEPDLPGADPLQLKRATLRGRVRAAGEGEALHETARAAYLGRFPEAAPISALGDFSFFVLEVEAGRLVTGFGGAATITRDGLAEAVR
jgi:hypothetical protein